MDCGTLRSSTIAVVSATTIVHMLGDIKNG